MSKAMRAALATLGSAVLAVSLIGVAPAAQASTGVTITSGGLSSIKTYTYQNSERGYITFTIRDRDVRAQVVSECTTYPNGRRGDCDSLVLRPMRFNNGDWRIRETANGWQVRALVVWGESSKEECLREYVGGDEYGVELTVLGEEEEILATRRHLYDSICQGYTGSTSGAEVLVGRVGRTVRMPVRSTIIDYGHRATSFRVCFVDEWGDRFNCATNRLSRYAKKTRSGWVLKDAVTFRVQTNRQCRTYRRDRPELTYALDIRDSRGRTLTRFGHDFTATCR